MGYCHRFPPLASLWTQLMQVSCWLCRKLVPSIASPNQGSTVGSLARYAPPPLPCLWQNSELETLASCRRMTTWQVKTSPADLIEEKDLQAPLVLRQNCRR